LHKILNFEGSQHFDCFDVIDFNYAKVYKNGPPIKL